MMESTTEYVHLCSSSIDFCIDLQPLHIALVYSHLPGLSPSEIERYGASFVRFKDPDGPEMHKDPAILISKKKNTVTENPKNVCYVRFVLVEHLETCLNML